MNAILNFIVSRPGTSLAIAGALACVAASLRRALSRDSEPATVAPIAPVAPVQVNQYSVGVFVVPAPICVDEPPVRQGRWGRWKKAALSVASGFAIFGGVVGAFKFFADSAPVVAAAVCTIA